MKKRRIFTAFAVLQIVLTMFYAGAQNKGGKVDFSANVMLPVKGMPADSSAYSLVGDVIFYHNGAVITCDSAVRYGERRMECFNNVVINQDSTYIYGDRAVYNGLTNMVDVFSPIVKVMDGNATLYTREFSFNTLDNIGKFGRGGIMRQDDLRLESQDGYYYSDTHDMICSGEVNMQDSVYKISTDSIRYNTDLKKAFFFNNTRIWSNDGNFIMADDGNYEVDPKVYDFTKNSYILTAEQEIIADSMWYDGLNGNAVLRNNIQIFDHENLFLAFGDYADYETSEFEDRVLLTKKPSLANYEQGQADTLFLRSDSMIFQIIRPDTTTVIAIDSLTMDSLMMDSTFMAMMMESNDSMPVMRRPNMDSLRIMKDSLMSGARQLDTDSLSGGFVVDSLAVGRMLDDTTAMVQHEIAEQDFAIDTLARDSVALDAFVSDTVAVDSMAVDSLPKPLSAKELKARAKAEKKEAARIKREEKLKAREEKYIAKMNARLEKAGLLDSLSLEAPLDSTALLAADSLAVADSLGLVADIIPVADTSKMERRLFHAFGKVKAFRTDLQMVCDSMVSYSIDSTVHMFGAPYMWSGENQINSEKAVLYSDNGQLDYMLFSGAPIMSSVVDTAHYNQVKGREITTLFENSEIYKVDVMGNAQTYYYMVEDSINVITSFLVAESADMTFIIEDRQMETITFYTQPVYSIYPMDKIPDTQSLLLPGFVWNSANRPRKYQVFDRKVVEPRREEVEAYKEPDFSIMQSIDSQRERLILREVWIDREDELSPETREFMREIERKNQQP